MYYNIKMKTQKMTIEADLPLLSGCISTAQSTCGKPNCACQQDPPQLHGPYYRWTGLIAGKPTTKTISRTQAQECRRRIKNYRTLQKKVSRLVEQSLRQAPWQKPEAGATPMKVQPHPKKRSPPSPAKSKEAR